MVQTTNMTAPTTVHPFLTVCLLAAGYSVGTLSTQAAMIAIPRGVGVNLLPVVSVGILSWSIQDIGMRKSWVTLSCLCAGFTALGASRILFKD